MFVVNVSKFAEPKLVNRAEIVLSDGTNATQVLIEPRVGQLVKVSGLHGYGTKYYPTSADELVENLYASFEENGFGKSKETIEGETFDNIEDAISYIQDVALVEATEVTDALAADIDKDIADVKQSLKELEDKRKKTFSFINKFTGAI